MSLWVTRHRFSSEWDINGILQSPTNRRAAKTMRILFWQSTGLAPCVGALSSPAAAQNVTTGFVQQAYVHDCCGRGPYVAVILDRPLTNPPSCTQWNIVAAASIATPLAKSLLATALAAKMAGRQVTV